MYKVDRLFGSLPCETTVWITVSARKKLHDFIDKDSVQAGKFLAKVQYYAQAGFGRYEGKQRPICPEGNGVYRVGERRSLFRLVGFYEDRRCSFVVVNAFEKSGQKLRPNEKEAIKEVARIARDWQPQKAQRS